MRALRSVGLAAVLIVAVLAVILQQEVGARAERREKENGVQLLHPDCVAYHKGATCQPKENRVESNSACPPSAPRGKLRPVNAYSHWSAADWVAHYNMGRRGGQAVTQHRAAGAWDGHGRRLPPAFATGQSLPERFERSVEQASHAASRAVHEGIETATSPRVILAGLAALGILGWVFVQSGRTVGRTARAVAPHAAKVLPAALPLLI